MNKIIENLDDLLPTEIRVENASLINSKLFSPQKSNKSESSQQADALLPSIHRQNPSFDFKERKNTFHKEKVRVIQTSEGRRIPHISLRFSNDNEGSIHDSPERNCNPLNEQADLCKV